MNSSSKILHRLLVATLLSGNTAAWANTAGFIQFVSGDVQLTNAAGETHPIKKGDAINEGDTLNSAKNSSAQIKMQDGGIIAVRPETRIKFDNFKFSGKQDGTEQNFTSLIKGGFRAITGAIGQINKSSYRITTPTSTIGIRGTDHETIVVVPDSELAKMAPDGTYNKVNVGETSITTNKGMISVLPNQMGFAGALNEQPKLQPINSNLFSATPPVNPTVKVTPATQSSSQKTDEKKSESKDTAASEQTTVRDKAVVDSRQSTTTSVMIDATPAVSETVTMIAPPVVIQASGQTYNLNNQTAITSPGAPTTPLAPLIATPLAIPTAAYAQTDLAVAFATSSANYSYMYYLYYFTEVSTLIAAPGDVNNSLPNPSLIDRYTGKNSASSVSYTLNGTTTIGEASTTLANGIQFGRYDSTSSQKIVAGSTNCCTAGTTQSSVPVYSHWITGPAVNPIYLSEALLGTTNYSYAGGTRPTSSYAGMTVTLDSATLSVNFTQQMVGFNLGLTVGGAAWGASATAVPLESLYWNSAKVGFRASTMTGSNLAALTVSGGATSGDVAGQLTGNALNGAILSYVLSDTSSQVAGVAAFTGPAANTATPYRIAALSSIGAIPTGQVNAGQVVPFTAGGYNNAASVKFDVAGNATQLNANQAFTNAGGANTFQIGSATAVALVTDPVSGISWGRWQGGTLSVTNLATNSTSSQANPNSVHWIVGPTMTAPVDLPISGSYNYVLAGGTAPTDSLGGIGTLNSASLSANFTAQTVNIGLNVTTPHAGNLIASGANIPIEQKNFFSAASANSPNGGANLGLLSVTCASGCGATAAVSGNIGGVFVGAGGIGAGMVYGLSNGSVNVNGVAAFHR